MNSFLMKLFFILWICNLDKLDNDAKEASLCSVFRWKHHFAVTTHTNLPSHQYSLSPLPTLFQIWQVFKLYGKVNPLNTTVSSHDAYAID